MLIAGWRLSVSRLVAAPLGAVQVCPEIANSPCEAFPITDLLMSDEIVDCPLCERRVFALNGVCPGCTTDLNNRDAVERHVLKRKALPTAIADRARGASLGQIEDRLRNEGADEDLIREILAHVEGKTPEAMVVKNDQDLRRGLYLLSGGVLVTAGTYFIAIHRDGGGYYIIAYGAVFGGGIQFLGALLKFRKRI